MASDKKCSRCGDRAESIDNLAETTFWGAIETITEVTTRRRVRFMATYIRGHGRVTEVMRVDEKQALCDPCWGLLIGQFMQGRAVAPVDHEHEWRRSGRIGGYPMERCNLCMRDRITSGEGTNA